MEHHTDTPLSPSLFERSSPHAPGGYEGAAPILKASGGWCLVSPVIHGGLPIAALKIYVFNQILDRYRSYKEDSLLSQTAEDLSSVFTLELNG